MTALLLVKDGEVVAAAQEKRFTRKKHDFNFPYSPIEYCLAEAQISGEQLDYVTFYRQTIY